MLILVETFVSLRKASILHAGLLSAVLSTTLSFSSCKDYLWNCRPLAIYFNSFSEVRIVHLIQDVHLQARLLSMLWRSAQGLPSITQREWYALQDAGTRECLTTSKGTLDSFKMLSTL